MNDDQLAQVMRTRALCLDMVRLLKLLREPMLDTDMYLVGMDIAKTVKALNHILFPIMHVAAEMVESRPAEQLSSTEQLHSSAAMIQQMLEGRTIQTIMYGHRSNDFNDEKFMTLTLGLDNGSNVNVWALPGEFTDTSLQIYFETSKDPLPYLGVSRLD